MIQAVLRNVIERNDLSEAEAYDMMSSIMSGEATESQIAGFLIALRMKGETVDEITGFARAMRAKVISVRSSRSPLVDTCGTGGDGTGTFNISTAAALVAAGAGVAIAKHGNRSVSSKCGSADVLEALGLRLDLSPAAVGQCLEEVGISFLFAPAFHPAMKHAVGPRREMGVRTVFNLLGPLTNPAGADAQVVGVYAADLVDPIAQVLLRLGARRAFVVHGKDGVDEISLSSSTVVAEVSNGDTKTYEVIPEDFGVERADRATVAGGTAEVNAGLIRDVLKGNHGPALDVTLMNASAAIVAGGGAQTLAEGMDQARESVTSGKASAKLEQWIAFTKRVSSDQP